MCVSSLIVSVFFFLVAHKIISQLKKWWCEYSIHIQYSIGCNEYSIYLTAANLEMKSFLVSYVSGDLLWHVMAICWRNLFCFHPRQAWFTFSNRLSLQLSLAWDIVLDHGTEMNIWTHQNHLLFSMFSFPQSANWIPMSRATLGATCWRWLNFCHFDSWMTVWRRAAFLSTLSIVYWLTLCEWEINLHWVKSPKFWD